MDQVLPDHPTRGRGAVSNQAGRYEPYVRRAIDDGWAGDRQTAREHVPPRLETTISADSSRTIIARNQSPDVPFDRSINPYRGCEHGCVYCFARPTHAFLGLSPGLDFETKILAKHDAAKLLSDELAKPGYRPDVIALGANTDPYQPIEREFKITRGVLQVLARAKHPVIIVTKSDLVLRDKDILGPMGRAGLARVMLSVTTLDRGLARRMEPRAPTPAKRLAAIRGLSEAGVPCGVLAAPMIPGAQRLRAGGDPGGLEAGRRGDRRLCPAAPATGDQGAVRGVARGPLPGTQGPRAQPGARDPGRQALRRHLAGPPARHRRLRPAARPPLQAGLQAPWLGPGARRAGPEPVRRAGKRWAAAVAVLSRGLFPGSKPRPVFHQIRPGSGDPRSRHPARPAPGGAT